MKTKSILVLSATLLALTACSDIREGVGLVNVPPDEFAVVDHPPLSMPPDFNLRPPRPGAPSPNAINPSTNAAKALYGDGKMETVPQQGVSSLKVEKLSPSEQAIIGQTGSSKADPRIRSTLMREGDKNQVVKSRRLLDEITFWKSPASNEGGTVVDPFAEKARLDKARATGQPINSGGTPALEKNNPVVIK